uniref:ChlH n=1 Tax=Streptomyces antibioticus TaxID=1890 RepID=Q0R4P4_STRAT|nr:ChlH [Streptomyces antibioticus]
MLSRPFVGGSVWPAPDDGRSTAPWARQVPGSPDGHRQTESAVGASSPTGIGGESSGQDGRRPAERGFGLGRTMVEWCPGRAAPLASISSGRPADRKICATVPVPPASGHHSAPGHCERAGDGPSPVLRPPSPVLRPP